MIKNTELPALFKMGKTRMFSAVLHFGQLIMEVKLLPHPRCFANVEQSSVRTSDFPMRQYSCHAPHWENTLYSHLCFIHMLLPPPPFFFHFLKCNVHCNCGCDTVTV